MKSCTTCHKELPESEFYPRTNKCKDCTKAGVRANRAARVDYYRGYDRARAMRPDRVTARQEYAVTEAGRESHARAGKRYRGTEEGRLVAREAASRYPEKRRARGMVAARIRNGSIRPLGCEVCGRGPTHAHHEDYSKPLNVRWLCVRHHEDVHHDRIALEAR